MSSAPSTPDLITLDEVLLDLEAGRSVAPSPADRLRSLEGSQRPALGGPGFVATYLAARVLGRVHPRFARRALLRLWFTPWVHPSAQRPVEDLPDGLVAWSLPAPDGTLLRGYAGGSGPTVVLVHGWSGRAADWRRLAGDLIAAGWRVVAPDLPAHGTTAGRRTDLFRLADAFGAVLEHERPAAVVAHSMGFPTTMLALERGAPAPGRLIALAPGRRIAHAVAAFTSRARLAPALTDELRRGIEARYGAAVWDTLDVDRVLPALAADGLVIHDADDDEVPAEDAEAIAAGWRGARLHRTQGLGHRRILRDEAVRARVVAELATSSGS
jgi:pimeloyl-ACP methyl ester carboxylesterase